ncbi:FG-GAP-like repeat-containing protein [Veronia pacifica]|uniref:Uncharacterized protein n=1 Tax=Veronia pacifica TaxID=1080227 RepID=A0A1C3ED31_9GAMM|nr:FG-GAP-like repeat-containing protein [Veronia pacifica]ODA31125.1 hypothetical protein A8L45_18295 [Veronia pacifica]
MKNTLISTLIAGLLLSGCGGDDTKTAQTSQTATPLDIETTFSARYIQSLPGKAPELAAYAAYTDRETKQAAKAVEQTRYVGKLQVTNVVTQKKQEFEWPVTQSVDSEGNVTTTSHRALTLKPGTYDFHLLLNSTGPNPKQYIATSLAHEVIEGEQPAIQFTVEPNLGDTITEISQIEDVPTLSFQWKADELAEINKPQFGLSLNGGKEQVYAINKETGLSEVKMNVEPGEYTLSMRLYDGDLMVGENGEGETVNFAEGEKSQTNIVPVQADVGFEVSSIKDRGNFSFKLPQVLVDEAGGLDNLTLKANLTAKGAPAQERLLTVQDVNGDYIAKDIFETGGSDKVDVYLAFYNTHTSQALEELTPFASCNIELNVATNQTKGCKTALKRESIITNRILGTLRLNVVNENWTQAEGANVFLDGKKIGVTGADIGAGTFKAHLTAGEHQLEVKQSGNAASETLTLKPLDVKNVQLMLKKDENIGSGNFVEKQVIITKNSIPLALAIGDVNTDGRMDIVTGSENGFSVGIGNSYGKFDFFEYGIYEPKKVYSVNVGHIDKDGHLDLVVISRDEERQMIWFYENRGNGEFKGRRGFGGAIVNGTYQNSKLADLTGNGIPDLVRISRIPEIFIGDGEYGFKNSKQIIHMDHSSDIVKNIVKVGDINDDGYPDIVVAATGSGGKVYLNDGKGRFDNAIELFPYTPDIAPTSVTLGDINNDGYLDIFVTNSNVDEASSNNVLFMNNGNNTFNVFNSGLGKNSFAAVIFDINKDGNLDILLSSGRGRVKFTNYLGMGDGFFSPQATSLDKNDYLTVDDIQAADLDSDGDVDLIIQGKSFKDVSHLTRIYENISN